MSTTLDEPIDRLPAAANKFLITSDKFPDARSKNSLLKLTLG
jgi:hypothetical protein